MLEIINNMTALQQFFLTCALGGTLIFAARTAMMFIGLSGGEADADISDFEADFEADFNAGMELDLDGGDTDLDVSSDTDASADSDASLSYLSIQSLTAFLMMFGWVGLAMSYESNLPGVIAVSGGIFAGFVTVWLLKLIFGLFLGLRSDGTMRIKSAMGAGGKVYLRIPAEGSGQIEVEVDGRLKIFDAVSKQKEEILTGEPVTVVWIQDNNTLVVEKDSRDEGGKLR